MPEGSPEIYPDTEGWLASPDELWQFARMRDCRLTDRSFSRLMNRLLAPRPGSGITGQTAALLGQLWENHPSSRGYDETAGPQLRLDVMHELIGSIVLERRYAQEMAQPTIREVGVKSLSLLADYLNWRLDLEGNDRLPLSDES